MEFYKRNYVDASGEPIFTTRTYEFRVPGPSFSSSAGGSNNKNNKKWWQQSLSKREEICLYLGAAIGAIVIGFLEHVMH